MGHVTLHSINRSEAIFCITNPSMRIIDSVVGPFLWSNGFLNAEKLAILPLEHLKTLAHQAGNPHQTRLQIILIHMTGRCGSTLLCQTLEKIPNTQVMSEPLSLSFPGMMYQRGEISYAEYKDILCSVFCVMCRQEDSLDRVVIKLHMNATPSIAILKQFCPSIQLVFNTRHIKQTILSWNKLMKTFSPSAKQWHPLLVMFRKLLAIILL